MGAPHMYLVSMPQFWDSIAQSSYAQTLYSFPSQDTALCYVFDKLACIFSNLIGDIMGVKNKQKSSCEFM